MTRAYNPAVLNSVPPMKGGYTITVGATVYDPARALLVSCTVGGTAAILMQDGSTFTLTFPVGITLLPLAVVGVTAAAATATFVGLY